MEVKDPSSGIGEDSQDLALPGVGIPWIPMEKLLLPKEPLQIPFFHGFRGCFPEQTELPNPEFPPWKSRIQREIPTLGMWEGIRWLLRILQGSKPREFLGNTREEPSLGKLPGRAQLIQGGIFWESPAP